MTHMWRFDHTMDSNFCIIACVNFFNAALARLPVTASHLRENSLSIVAGTSSTIRLRRPLPMARLAVENEQRESHSLDVSQGMLA